MGTAAVLGSSLIYCRGLTVRRVSTVRFFKDTISTTVVIIYSVKLSEKMDLNGGKARI
jgi:hypothetical protein